MFSIRLKIIIFFIFIYIIIIDLTDLSKEVNAHLINKNIKKLSNNLLQNKTKILSKNLNIKLYKQTNFSIFIKNSSINVLDNEVENFNKKRKKKKISPIDNIIINENELNVSTNTNIEKIKLKNRCDKNNGNCLHICQKYGERKCRCFKGYRLNKNKISCIDIDECLISNGGCEQKCYNTQGSYYCDCNVGFRLENDLKTCKDINECFLRNGHGPCQSICKNTYGSYICGCSNNTRLSGDGHSCVDIDECTEKNSGCSHDCINTLGRAFCSCPLGLELGPDWKTCIDINECENREIINTCVGCVNSIGSYHCQSKIQNDQPYQRRYVIPDCSVLKKPKYGYIKCKKENGSRKNLGATCWLICPKGYKMIGRFNVLCGLFGNWLGYKNGRCEKIH